jgi:hypothetical protein
MEPIIANNGKQSMWSETGIASFSDLLTYISDSLLQPFLLPGQTLAVNKDGSIPVVVPYSAAQQLLNLPNLPSSASATETLTRLKSVRSKVGGLTLQACYRNAASAALLSQAIDDQEAIQQNKGKASYQEPDRVYGVPTQACAPVPIARDIRSADEKQADSLQEQFSEAFGTTPPTQQMLTFRVVGIVPDDQQGNATKIDQIFSTLFKSTLGSGWFMPESQLSAANVLSNFFSDATTHAIGTYPSYYVEFRTAAEEQRFIARETCADNTYDKCLQDNKPFAIAAFGSNSAALSRLRSNIARIVSFAALVATVLAIIFMGGTVGRIIVDSRRETAIFRAMGAKRRDIAAIYISYTLLLSLFVTAFSAMLGFIAAMIVSNHYSPAFTTKALIAYSPKDLAMTATLYHVDIRAVSAVAICIVAIGILSSVIPLIRNNRRNPIRDMREQ